MAAGALVPKLELPVPNLIPPGSHPKAFSQLWLPRGRQTRPPLTIFFLGGSKKWGSLRPRRSSSSKALAKPGCPLVRKGQPTQATESRHHSDPQVRGSPGSFLLWPGARSCLSLHSPCLAGSGMQ